MILSVSLCLLRLIKTRFDPLAPKNSQQMVRNDENSCVGMYTKSTNLFLPYHPLELVGFWCVWRPEV